MLPYSHLATLYLSDNNIGDEGASEIMAGVQASSLTKLDLSSNKIGLAGAKVIAATMKDTALLDLNLGCNEMGHEGIDEIISQLSNACLKKLNLFGQCQRSYGMNDAEHNYADASTIGLIKNTNTIRCHIKTNEEMQYIIDDIMRHNERNFERARFRKTKSESLHAQKIEY